MSLHLIPWHGPHIKSDTCTSFDSFTIDTQSSPIIYNKNLSINTPQINLLGRYNCLNACLVFDDKIN